MRKLLLLTLTLAAASFATMAPKAEATTTCSWQCGLCGVYCPCDQCKGPMPYCVCG
jgi:hypothetical protein